MSGIYSQLRAKSELKQQTTSVEVDNSKSTNSEKVESSKDNQPKRAIKRFSHDLYIDQMKTLNTKTLAYFLAKGERKSVTQMVREAVDDYIKKHQ